MTVMEGGQRAAVLLGADYEKVFNHMDHTVCIAKLSFFKRIHRGSEPAVFMYVDDTTDVDIVGVDTATLHLSTRATSAENKNLAIEVRPDGGRRLRQTWSSCAIQKPNCFANFHVSSSACLP